MENKFIKHQDRKNIPQKLWHFQFYLTSFSSGQPFPWSAERLSLAGYTCFRHWSRLRRIQFPGQVRNGRNEKK
jgi:hypothetical protein